MINLIILTKRSCCQWKSPAKKEAVFKTSANVGAGFPYHQFVDAENEDAFNEFIHTVKELSMYDTGLTAQYGDKLLCLSTCEYTLNNGRFVVVAKRLI